jgi:hypothetical protein
MNQQELHSDPAIHYRVKEAAGYIDLHPGTKGEEIAGAIHVTFDHFRKSIVPILKRYGYQNHHNGNGYFPPPSSQQLQ